MSELGGFYVAKKLPLLHFLLPKPMTALFDTAVLIVLRNLRMMLIFEMLNLHILTFRYLYTLR